MAKKALYLSLKKFDTGDHFTVTLGDGDKVLRIALKLLSLALQNPQIVALFARHDHKQNLRRTNLPTERELKAAARHLQQTIIVKLCPCSPHLTT